MPPAWPGLPLTANHYLLPHTPDTPRRTWSGGNRFCPAAKQEIVPLPRKIRPVPGGISVSPDGLPGFFLSAIPDNASSSAPISASSDPVPSFPFCAQAQRDSIRTSVRKYVITCFGILFITAPFKRHHSIPWHKRGSLRPQWGGSDPHSGCVIRCCPAWALLLRSMADTSHDSSMGDLPLWRRPKRFPTDAGICHR